MTLAHWTYLLGLATLIATVVGKKNVVGPAIAATFVTALAYGGSVTTGLAAVFNAGITAATELLPIFVIIATVTAMLGAMRTLGSDLMMVAPLQRLVRNGHVAYLVLGVVTYLLSLSFWPTPVLPLIAAILLPAAVRVGLPPLAAAIAIAITGQGMALSSDYIMGVASGLSSQGARVPAGDIADRALAFSVIAGLVALGIAYLRDVRGKILVPAEAAAVPAGLVGGAGSGPAGVAGAGAGAEGAAPGLAVGTSGGVPARGDGGAATLVAGSPKDGDEVAGGAGRVRPRLVATVVPLAFVVLLVFMLLGRFTSLVPGIDDGQGAPLVGGTAALALVAVSIVAGRRTWLQDCADHFSDGIGFAFRTMGVVIPIAGFVYIGLSDYSGRILGLPDGAAAPAFLLDAIGHVQPHIPHVPVFASFAMLLVGMVIGLDGNGWPGLPFTGSLAGELGQSTGADPATLAAIAQNGATWTGGGTLVIWSSLIVVAGLTGVPVIDLARRLFLPVVAGLVVATAIATVAL